jgi:hypothetical protein
MVAKISNWKSSPTVVTRNWELNLKKQVATLHNRIPWLQATTANCAQAMMVHASIHLLPVVH